MNRKDKPKLWKDHVDRASLRCFAESLKKVYPRFESDRFVAACAHDGFETLELKARLTAVARCLAQFLPADFEKAADLVIAAAPQTTGFHNWILTSYVEQFGLEHLDASVRAMKELTKYGSSEFCIRPFIIRYEKQMLKTLARWVKDPNEHVRRLAAEGSRPRGVWTLHIESFKKDPTPVLALLEPLKADPSLYVRKAVANNLNDISKDHAGLVLKTALAWKKSGNTGTDWIIRHACRSLIKSGHPEVFGLLGFAHPPRVKLSRIENPPRKVRIGESAPFSFEIKSTSAKPQKLAIDYRVHYVTGSGRASSKVFKLAEKSIKAGEQVSVSGRHRFQDTSGRKHLPGSHRLEFIVNGQVFGQIRIPLSR